MKKMVLFLLINFTFVNCGTSQINNNKIYQILNLSLNEITRKDNDTIYVKGLTFNDGLKERIKNKKLITKTDDYDLIKILSDANEIKHLTSQLKDTFLIDFSKINVNKATEYIKLIEEKNERGYYIQTKESIADFSRIKYTFSKPIFTRDNLLCFIVQSSSIYGAQIRVFKREDNKWKHYKYISYPY